MLSSAKTRYLLIGGINTLFGYLVGIYTYKLLNDKFGILWVGLIANIIAISFSFVSYKLWVFKTRGRWLTEYLKSYIVYGSSALMATSLLWIFIDRIRLSIWLAQALALVGAIVLSYIGHTRITFYRKSTDSRINEKSKTD